MRLANSASGGCRAASERFDPAPRAGHDATQVPAEIESARCRPYGLPAPRSQPAWQWPDATRCNIWCRSSAVPHEVGASNAANRVLACHRIRARAGATDAAPLWGYLSDLHGRKNDVPEGAVSLIGVHVLFASSPRPGRRLSCSVLHGHSPVRWSRVGAAQRQRSRSQFKKSARAFTRALPGQALSPALGAGAGESLGYRATLLISAIIAPQPVAAIVVMVRRPRSRREKGSASRRGTRN